MHEWAVLIFDVIFRVPTAYPVLERQLSQRRMAVSPC